MTPSNKLLVTLILFVWISVLLSVFDIISLDYEEIIAFTLLFLGISIFYKSFYKIHKTGTFLGSFIFLAGMVLLITSYFETSYNAPILIPSFLLSAGISLFMAFLSDNSDRKFLYLGIIIAAMGLFVVFDLGNPGFGSYFISMKNILKKFWVLLVLLAILITILSREK